jgi:hypothetical protein
LALLIVLNVVLGSRQELKARASVDALSNLQIALLIPILAGLIGLFNSFRMMRLPDPKPSGSAEGMVLG